MAFTYTGDPTASDIEVVRFEIQDTDAAAPLLQDAEIAYAILDETGLTAGSPATLTGGALYSAAARCCEVLVVNFTRQADSEIGSLKTTYSAQAKNFADQAQRLRAKAIGYNAPYAGGLSRGENESWSQDPDRVQPKFRRDQFGNRMAGAPDGRPPFGF